MGFARERRNFAHVGAGTVGMLAALATMGQVVDGFNARKRQIETAAVPEPEGQQHESRQVRRARERAAAKGR